MKLSVNGIAISALACLLLFGTSQPCCAKSLTGRGMNNNENTVTLKGIAKSVPDQPGSLTKHLEMTVAGITYRLKSDMLTQADIKRCDGCLFTATGSVSASNDKVKVLNVVAYDFESPEPSSPSSGKPEIVADEHYGHAGGQNQNNVYVLTVDRVNRPAILRMYIHGSNGTDTSGDVILKQPDGTETIVYRWNSEAVAGKPTGAKKYTDVTPVEADVSQFVNQPGKYEVRFKYLSGHFGLVILKVELATTAKTAPDTKTKQAASTALAGSKATWYDLASTQKYVSDFLLNPGMAKSVTVPAKKACMVGFKSNATYEQAQKYGMTATHPLTGVKMEQASTRDAVESVSGAGTNFTPKNGRIDLKVTNRTKEALKVVVYYEEE